MLQPAVVKWVQGRSGMWIALISRLLRGSYGSGSSTAHGAASSPPETAQSVKWGFHGGSVPGTTAHSILRTALTGNPRACSDILQTVCTLKNESANPKRAERFRKALCHNHDPGGARTHDLLIKSRLLRAHRSPHPI